MTNANVGLPDYVALSKARADYEELLRVVTPIAARIVGLADSPREFNALSIRAIGIAHALISHARAELAVAEKAARA